MIRDTIYFNMIKYETTRIKNNKDAYPTTENHESCSLKVALVLGRKRLSKKKWGRQSIVQLGSKGK
jgi:hypothetical protein